MYGHLMVPLSLTFVIREADFQRHFLDLYLEEVLLVEEEDQARFEEERVVADVVE